MKAEELEIESDEKSFSKSMEELKQNLAAVQKVFANYTEMWSSQLKTAIEPIIAVQVRLVEIFTKINLPKRFKCHKLFGEANYIFFERFTDEEAQRLLDSKNIDVTLLELHKENKFHRLNKIIKYCTKHSLMERNINLFNQSILAYKKGHYHLSVIGLFATIDGLLTAATESNKTLFMDSKDSKRIGRVEILKSKLYLKDEKANEYALAELYYLYETFFTMANSIFRNVDLEEDTDTTLNRHSYMHGRTTRITTQIDGIKLICFIFANLKLYDIYI